jgi:biotin transport system substrate-specific component
VSLTAPAPRVVLDPLARTWVGNVVLVLAGAAFIGLAAQVSLPVPGTPVPVTGQTFAVLLVGAAAGLWRGVASTALYAVVGLAGVPWFAGGASGMVTATFGYILGFVLAAAVVGLLAQRGWTRSPWRTFASMLVGSAVIYAVGVPWLKAAVGVTWSQAVSLGLTPFLVGDLLKAALAAGIFTLAWRWIDARRSA